MSGGSYNYLYCKDVPELMNEVSCLEDMTDFLVLNNYHDVAMDMRRLVEYIKTAENRITVLSEQLKGVMKAVEYYESCDYGRDDLDKAIEKYRKGESHDG